MGPHERGAFGLVSLAFPALNQAITIQHGMDGTDRWWLDHGIGPDQLVADLGRAPGWVLFLDTQNSAFDLEGQLVGLTIGPPATIVQGVQTAIFVTVEDLVASDTGDAELTAQGRHLLTLKQSGNKSEAFIHWLTLFPRHLGSPQMHQCVNHVSGIICKLSVRKHKQVTANTTVSKRPCRRLVGIVTNGRSRNSNELHQSGSPSFPRMCCLVSSAKPNC